jgi:hypothetical protein
VDIFDSAGIHHQVGHLLDARREFRSLVGGAIDLPDRPVGPNDLTRLERFNRAERRSGAAGYIR